MDIVTLGRTGLRVSAACLGTGGHSRLGQAKGASFEHSVNVVKAAMDLGINFIDTSVGYDTEEIVGAAIKGKRDAVIISTKNHIVKKGSSYTGTEYVTGAEYKKLFEDNLKRLGTDYIDVFHAHGIVLHQYDYTVKEIVPVIYKLREEGKIRYTAISERFNVETRHDMLERCVSDDYFDVMMVAFNFMNQTALRRIIPEAKKKGIATQCIYAVRSGLSSFDKANKLVADGIASGEVDAKDIDDPKNPLGFLLTEGGARDLPNACYRFVRHSPGADVTLTGTGSIDHLKENVRSINDPPLPKAVIDKLHRMFGRVETISAD